MVDTLRSKNLYGDEIRAIRQRLHLTQQRLADLLGVRRNSVTRWELGTLGIKRSALILLRRLAADADRQGRDANGN
jgi:DNA-binding transcriptional regulator YiaG